MEFLGFEETAKTPKLGGFFGDVIIIVKPNLLEEQQRYLKKIRKVRYEPSKGKEVSFVDINKVNDNFYDDFIKFIAGWENVTRNGKPLEFTPANRDEFFMNLIEQKTGHELELKAKAVDDEENRTGKTEKRIATLREYIVWFVGDPENFAKNLKSTSTK